MTKVRYEDPYFQALDDSGASISGAKLFFYAEGTTTLNNTYQDEANTSLNTNPIISDGNGRFAPIWMKDQTYTVKMTDADGVTIKTSVYDATEPGVIAAASTTVAGKIEIATLAEVRTGTDTSRAVTPEGTDEAKKTLRTGREETGTSFTLLETDAGKIIYANNGSAITVTVDSSVNLADQVVLINQYGAGQVTVAAGTATLRNANGLKTQAQYSTLQITFKSASEAIVTGDTAT